MIYLVSKQTALFNSSNYMVISKERALEMLSPLEIISADTETEGLDPYTKKLLSIQLGNSDFQIVIDCLTINILFFKELLETKPLMFWNAGFDLMFLYHNGIYPNHIYDGFLAEKLLWLGYDRKAHGFSLKDAGQYYLGIDLDKSVRGKIITVGLTDEVVVYGANDIKYQLAIKDKQAIELQEKDLVRAVEFENEFVKCLAYIKYCGVKLDVDKWKQKADNDLAERSKYEKLLNQYVIKWCSDNPDKIPTTIYYYADSSEFFSNTMLQEWISENIPTRATRCPAKDNGTIMAWVLRQSNPFININTQGDLFEGFNTEPTCTINWSSQKQVIPFFKLLGINTVVNDPKTGKQKDSIEDNVLSPQRGDFEILPIYSKYQEYSKLTSTYGYDFLKLINPVSGRIHSELFQLGADSGRLSSRNPNIQNLPRDEFTRSCFIPESGNAWISADYSGQESFLMASLANDTAMLDELVNGSGDLHSLTAKIVFPQIPRDMPLKEVKKNFPELRQEAKGYEFCFNYLGNDFTLVMNYGLSRERAKEIYENYMNGFSGLKAFQEFRKRDVFDKGYILISPITGHKCFVPEMEYVKEQLEKQKSPGFWENYKLLKLTDPSNPIIGEVKRLSKMRGDIEKHSGNYVIQGAGALCFKLASIKLFNYLKQHNLLNVVKYCVPVHDEINLECPKEMAENIAKVLVQCMEAGGAPFCTRAKLTADYVIAEHWVH